MLSEFRLDHAGIAEILKSAEMQGVITGKAEEVAGNLALEADVDVVVDEYTTDRAAASVTIRDVRGALWQARDGVLTRAASTAGLEVTERS